MPSKTQLAFERRDLTALTRIGVRKCMDLHAPVSTDDGAEHIKHARTGGTEPIATPGLKIGSQES